MFKKSSMRVYEIECKKGYFRIEIEDIEEEEVNGSISNRIGRLYYRDDVNCGITDYFEGNYIPKDQNEEEFVRNEYDYIMNTDYYDNLIYAYKKDMQRREEQFLKDLKEMNN